MEKEFGPEYASVADAGFIVKYRASCYCRAVQMEVCADPVDATICHCFACQSLHGAPMQWAAIFHKHDVRIAKGMDCLKFYNSEQNINERVLPSSAIGVPHKLQLTLQGRTLSLMFCSLL